MATHPVAHMALSGIGCWALVAWLVGGTSQGAVLLGVLGPLAAASTAWIVMARAHARAPERLSGVMIRLFAAKMVLFGAYVSAVVTILPSGHDVGFILSFTAAYVLLHVMEALYLRRLLSGGIARPGR